MKRKEISEMKSKVLYSLFVAMFLIATSWAYGYVVFQDDFNIPDGPSPNWDVLSGTFVVQNQKFVPCIGTANWVESIAAPKDLILDQYTLTATVETDGGSQNLWWVMAHWKNASNFMRIFVDMTINKIYWQAVVNGSWIYDPPRYPVDCTGLNWAGPLYMTVEWDATGAKATLSDGSISFTSALPDAEIPAEVKGNARVCLARYQWGTAPWTTFDDVVIDNKEALAPGNLSGKVSDSKTTLPIGQATVEIVGTGLSMKTAAGGTYSFTDVPAGQNQLSVRKNGYVAVTEGVLIPAGGDLVKDIALDPISLDQARSAVASTSVNPAAASRVSDGDPSTGWNAEPANIDGEWIQLAWDDSVDISQIVVDASGVPGALPDYYLESSTDGSNWTNIGSYPRIEFGHPHWLRVIDLASPRTMKYLRLHINSAPGDAFGNIWSIECYKATGSVAGYVKDTNGPVANATVFVTEVANDPGNPANFVRGPGRLPVSGTTNTSGYYNIPVPEGTAMVTAWAFDSLTISSEPQSISIGSSTSVPDLVISRRAGPSAPFSDDFEAVPSGQPNPNWTAAYGDPWLVIDHPIQIPDTGNIYESFALNGATSVVNGNLCRDGVLEVDMFMRAVGGIVARYTGWPNFVDLRLDGGSNLGWYENANTLRGSSVYAPLDTDAVVHMRAVVAGNMCQGFVTDSSHTQWGNTYWTEPVQLTNLSSGQVGLFAPSTSARWFDNFRVSDGTAPPPTLVGIGTAKAAGPGWFGMIKGYVTATFACYNTFVVENEDRSSAITVTPWISSLNIGDEVVMLGAIQDDGTFRPVELATTGNEKILDPVGVNNRDMVAIDNAGLNNSDLLVTCWGKIADTPVVSLVDGSTTFHVTDGSAMGYSTAEILGPWVSAFEDDFVDRKAEWIDKWDPTLVMDSMLNFDGYNKTIVDGLSLQDTLVTTDVVIADNSHIGLMLRWTAEFLIGMWWQNENRISIHYVTGAGNWGDSMGDINDVQLNLPVHMSLAAVGNTATLRLSDGARAYSTTITHTQPPATGTVGVYHEAGYVAIDNFRVYAASSPISVDGDLVQVTIPACVAGAISVNQGDHVRVNGIVGRGSTVQGNLRGITIRQADDLSKVQ